MKNFLAALVLSIAFVLFTQKTVSADGDFAEDQLISFTQPITLPYEFEPIDFSNADAEDLNVDLVNPAFINWVGSIALTLFSILDSFAILGIFVVLMLAIWCVFLLWRFVTETPSSTTLKVFDAAEVASNIYDTQLEREEAEAERMARLSGERSLGDRHRAIVSQRRDVARFRRFNRAIKRSSTSLRNPFR
jgi:hypothetical protein